MSKSLRLSKIFNPDTGNTLILPVDHGLMGSMKGLENPIKLLKELLTPDIDAVLLNDGVARRAESVFHGRNAPGRLLNSDMFNFDNNGRMNHELSYSPETALRNGYDCIKLVLFWDRPENERMRSMKLIASCIEEANKWEMPVLVEPLTSQPITNEEQSIQVLTDATRAAFELGADVLKVPHPGDTSVLKDWVQYFNVPLILLGGGKNGTTKGLVNLVEESVNVGVRGVAIGRNVWQRPISEAKDVLSQFSKVVHKMGN